MTRWHTAATYQAHEVCVRLLKLLYRVFRRRIGLLNGASALSHNTWYFHGRDRCPVGQGGRKTCACSPRHRSKDEEARTGYRRAVSSPALAQLSTLPGS